MKKVIAIAIVVLCTWLVTAFPYVMLNPGELTEGHQKIKGDCKECHNPFWGISSEKCIGCHKLSEIGKDSLNPKGSVNFHSSLAKEECTSCHSDHKGIKPTVSISNFNHDLLSADAQANCSSCHEKPADKLHQQVSGSCSNCHGKETWKPAVAFNHNSIDGAVLENCLSCHKKPTDSFHESFKEKCSQCHGTNKWVPSTFDHSSYFVLDGNHNASCRTCHVDESYRSYTCYGCHEHSENNIRRKHEEEGIYNFSNCTSCHKSGSEHGEGNENGGGEHGGHEGHDDD